MEREFIFMKLRSYDDENGMRWSGQRVMDAYTDDERQRGYTWFSTDSLPHGMSEKRVSDYNGAIRAGETVRILFAINDENHDNDIAYSAQVLRVYSESLPVRCPELNGEPQAFRGETARIWIQISGIEEEQNIRADMLKTSKGRDLKEVIQISQCHFCYVSFK